MDREWFCIESPSGGAMGTGENYPNKETANAAAKALAPECNVPLTLVKYTRREIKTYERLVSIKETDIGTVTPA